MMKTVGAKPQPSTSQPISTPSIKPVNDSLKDLTIEEAKRLFLSYAQELTTQKRTSLAAFLADPLLTMGENNTVIFTVGSKIVESDIAEETPKIVAYFEASGYVLKNLTCNVNAKQISEYKVFSPKQQFEALAKEYPKLTDFAERFYLDFD
ncbi:MAG: hypothetical protein P8I31_02200 [Bacteroidia bacterium]|nr:hypothetical protein [Bacteroidia bacterium]